MRAAIVIVSLWATGCATQQTMLRHPQTGEIVQCGTGGPSRGAAEQTAHECIHQYQEQGFVKVR